MRKRINLLQGDCIDLMHDLRDESVDLVLCDVPYGVTKNDWDHPLSPYDLYRHYDRILKKNGTIILFCMEPYASRLRIAMEKIYKFDYQWKKSRKHGYVHAGYRPLTETECILVFSKGHMMATAKNKATFNPQGVEEVIIEKVCREGIVERVVKTTNHPTNILDFPSVLISEKFHPTQKPVDLLSFLIEVHSNPNDVVLDHCMGSGTTGLACKKTKRKFIGMEKNPEFFDLAHLMIAEKLKPKVRPFKERAKKKKTTITKVEK